MAARLGLIGPRPHGPRRAVWSRALFEAARELRVPTVFGAEITLGGAPAPAGWAGARRGPGRPDPPVPIWSSLP